MQRDNRRPVLLAEKKRQMLENIRNNLSHLRKSKPDTDPAAAASPRPDGGGGRTGYNKEAMAEIRRQLDQYSLASGSYAPAGSGSSDGRSGECAKQDFFLTAHKPRPGLLANSVVTASSQAGKYQQAVVTEAATFQATQNEGNRCECDVTVNQAESRVNSDPTLTLHNRASSPAARMPPPPPYPMLRRAAPCEGQQQIPVSVEFDGACAIVTGRGAVQERLASAGEQSTMTRDVTGTPAEVDVATLAVRAHFPATRMQREHKSTILPEIHIHVGLPPSPQPHNQLSPAAVHLRDFVVSESSVMPPFGVPSSVRLEKSVTPDSSRRNSLQTPPPWPFLNPTQHSPDSGRSSPVSVSSTASTSPGYSRGISTVSTDLSPSSATSVTSGFGSCESSPSVAAATTVFTMPPPPYPGSIRVGGSPFVSSVDSVGTTASKVEVPFWRDSAPGCSMLSPGQLSPVAVRCESPIPERKPEAKQKDAERRETRVQQYSPQAFKFYMEQHVENVLKQQRERLRRRAQLEAEMDKVALCDAAKTEMRLMLRQKESNFLRMRRAKMERSMFDKVKVLGVGAFGEVSLVRRRDSTRQLYAMKTLRKADVLRKNQVAHVKAERDILAEADCDWVVKLYYSFQDETSLYFIMEYIPGGDLMSLLIRLGTFDEALARFYIAELTLAIESVHRMGFIHRDIKPDNILIDKDGHIKLTDFGLCTGFRWTHNSRYYQNPANTHGRQDSMEVSSDCTTTLTTGADGDVAPLKTLERRRRREGQHRLAHSLVGTPNYIAPEVLLRSGYTRSCDWWSLGVILFEMLVGCPPFLASSAAETQYKIINWETTLHIPEDARLSFAASNLIMKLCSGPEERLGRGGASEVKRHMFFASLSFESLRKQRAPHRPLIAHETDTSNFDPVEESDSPGACSGDDDVKSGQYPEHAFMEFTFRRFFDDSGHPLRLRPNEDVVGAGGAKTAELIAADREMAAPSGNALSRGWATATPAPHRCASPVYSSSSGGSSKSLEYSSCDELDLNGCGTSASSDCAPPPPGSHSPCTRSLAAAVADGGRSQCRDAYRETTPLSREDHVSSERLPAVGGSCPVYV